MYDLCYILVMQLHKLYVMTDKMQLPARSRDAIAQGCLCITVMGVTPDSHRCCEGGETSETGLFL